jgi:Domain of unknown function (DUF4180)
MSNGLETSEAAGSRFLEGPPDGELLLQPRDWTRIVEACSAAQTRLVLLYAPNMTPQFFDLSSGEAGEILQKLRSFGLRIALVCPPGRVQFSTRFPEVIAEENRLPYFRFFESAEAARAWLLSA